VKTFQKNLLAGCIFFISGFLFGTEKSEDVNPPNTDTFVLMVYNVENLFDIDGVALFDDYRQEPADSPEAYSAAKLLTKIDHHCEILRQCNDGRGPDIVAFQEFENDFTQDPAFSLDAALAKYAEKTVESLLEADPVSPEIAGYPVEFFLIKRLKELGLGDYHFYQPEFDPTWKERGIAHRCVFLSRFPAIEMHQYPLLEARDIFEVTFDVGGHPFTVFNNHWKSGASSPRSEPVRVQNAGVMRQVLEAHLKDQPEGDFVLVGDFNSHHNQSLRMNASVETTGTNGVLKSQSNEYALIDGKSDLYNLWYDLPQQQRGSEVWAGEWGTLMQIIVTRGLYDQKGIQYVDNSFRRFAILGQNLTDGDSTPFAWVGYGRGEGYSDHLPVYAIFRYSNDSECCLLPPVATEKLGHEVENHHIPIPVDYSLTHRKIHNNARKIENATIDELTELMGQLFRVDGFRTQSGIRIGDVEFALYAPVSAVRDWLNQKNEGDEIRFVGELGFHRGKLQFIIHDWSWVDVD